MIIITYNNINNINNNDNIVSISADQVAVSDNFNNQINDNNIVDNNINDNKNEALICACEMRRFQVVGMLIRDYRIVSNFHDICRQHCDDKSYQAILDAVN